MIIAPTVKRVNDVPYCTRYECFHFRAGVAFEDGEARCTYVAGAAFKPKDVCEPEVREMAQTIRAFREGRVSLPTVNS